MREHPRAEHRKAFSFRRPRAASTHASATKREPPTGSDSCLRSTRICVTQQGEHECEHDRERLRKVGSLESRHPHADVSGDA